MYSVYYRNPHTDSICFYDNSVSGYGINGANNDLTLIDPILTLEDSLAGEFNFIITPNNIAYHELEKLTTVIEVWKKNKVYWRGRIIEQSSDFYNQISTHCEGSMAYLNDTNAPYKIYNNIPVDEYFKSLLNAHNNMVKKVGDTNKIIEIGNVTVQGKITHKITNYETIMSLVQELVDTFGGHLQMLYEKDGSQTINWLSDYPNTSTQSIQFRSNLMDYTSSFDESEFCTAIIPQGDSIEVTMESHFFEKGSLSEIDGSDVVNDTTIRINHLITYMGNGNNIKIEIHTNNIECEQISIKLFMFEYNGYVLKKVTERYYANKINDSFIFEVPFDIYSKIQGIPGFKFVIMFDGRTLPDDVINDVYIYSEEKLNLCPIQNGIPYIANEEMVSYHGWICKTIDFSEYQNVTNTVNDILPLKKAAEEYLAKTQFNEITIELTAFDLSILNPKKSIEVPINTNCHYTTSDGKYLVTSDGKYYILRRE